MILTMLCEFVGLVVSQVNIGGGLLYLADDLSALPAPAAV